MILSPSKYACDLLAHAQMSGSKAISTPVAVKNHTSDASTPFYDPQLYQYIVGGLVGYNTLTMTGPDLPVQSYYFLLLPFCPFVHFSCINEILMLQIEKDPDGIRDSLNLSQSGHT